MVITDILWMAFLFLIPGMASYTVYRHVAGYVIDKLYKFIFYSAVWSIFDYGIVEFVFGKWLYGIPFGKCFEVWKMFQYKYTDISLQVILWVLVMGAVVAFLAGLMTRRIRLNSKGVLYSKLWDYYLNVLWKGKNRVAVYDYKNKCRYVGEIKSFSYFTSRKELVLRNVEIYSFTKEEKVLKKIEEAKEVYLQLEDSNFAVLNLGESKETGTEGGGIDRKNKG